ncbi:zinc finger, CCHC-type containing protein [Tanacetum coccineum]
MDNSSAFESVLAFRQNTKVVRNVVLLCRENVKTQKNLWDNLGTAKNLAEDALKFTQHKMNMDESIQVSCIIDKLSPSWKDFKHREKTKECKANNVGIIANGQTWKGSEDRSCQPSERVTMHVCKDRCWFKTYESLNDGSILHIGNESTALVHGRGYVDLRLNIVSDNIDPSFMSTSKMNDSILWHARLGHVHFKRMQDMSKDGLITAFDMDTEKFQTCMLNKITKKPFQNVKRETKVLELIHSNLCDLHATPSLRNKKYFVTFIDDASRTDRGGLSQGFWSEVMEVVRLPNLKLKTLGERGIECIFVGYAEHSKVFRFYVIEPNDSVAINSIIESRDAIFDEHRGLAVSSPEYSRVNWLLNVVTRLVPKTWTLHLVRVDKLSRLKYSGYPISVGEVTTDATGITTLKKFVYTGWGSKKQTYITGSTIESEFMALAAAGKEAEWLKNLLLEIPLWVKPMAPISIRCDSAATLSKAYS